MALLPLLPLLLLLPPSPPPPPLPLPLPLTRLTDAQTAKSRKLTLIKRKDERTLEFEQRNVDVDGDSRVAKKKFFSFVDERLEASERAETNHLEDAEANNLIVVEADTEGAAEADTEGAAEADTKRAA